MGYKEKMSKLEKVFETLNQRIEELQVKRKADTDRLESNEVKQLESKLSKVENEKVQALKEKADLTGDLEMKKREVTKLISEKTAVESELQAMKDKKPEVAVDSENVVELRGVNEKLLKELKEVKLDLRIEKRELEKKGSLVTYIREKEAKNKEKIEELEKEKSVLEKEVNDLKSSLESAVDDA